MSRGVICFALVAAALIAPSSIAAHAASAQVERGKYLVEFGGCNDCHTPGYFFGKPDAARYLGGSDVGFEIPGLGVFLGRNITPDKETGIGDWTEEQIVTAIQTGIRPDGRVLAPIMPWHAFAKLTKDDAHAIAVFLKTVKPVHHAIPGPFGPGDKVSSFMFRILPPGQTVAGPPPAAK
jgi:mono/diheme cytochrome c family protein